MKKDLEVKTEMLGPKGEPGCVDQMQFLIRIVSWDHRGIRYEPDPRHTDIVIGQLGLEGAKGVTSLGVPATKARSECDGDNPKDEQPGCIAIPRGGGENHLPCPGPRRPPICVQGGEQVDEPTTSIRLGRNSQNRMILGGKAAGDAHVVVVW